VNRTCLQTRSHRRQDCTKLFSLQYIADQPSNHVFKVGGSSSLVYGITTFLQKEIRQVYPVWCSRLHNHTLFIKKLCKTWGFVQILGGSDAPLPSPQWLHHYSSKSYAKVGVSVQILWRFGPPDPHWLCPCWGLLKTVLTCRQFCSHHGQDKTVLSCRVGNAN